jgi:hypothetical protein
MFNYSNYKTKKRKGFSFVLLLWLLLPAATAFSQTAQYELNDPRNPDCPCHKAQKQAEQEYAQLNSSIDKVLNAEKDPPANAVAPDKNNVIASAASTHDTAVAGKNKRKNKISRIRKLTFRYSRKHRGLKKMHTDYSVCFHNW